VSKKRTTADIAAFSQLLTECEIEASWGRGVFIFNKMMNFFNPDPVREAAEKLEAAFAKILAWVKNLLPGQMVSLEEAMEIGGLDPRLRTARAAVRRFLSENGVLAHIPAKTQNERWQKLITHQLPEEEADQE